MLDLGTLKVGPDGSVSVPVTLRLKVDTPAPTPTPEKPPVPVTPEPTPGGKRPYLPPEDAQAAAQYYAETGAVSDPKARFLALSQLLTRTHRNQPRYNPSSEVYPWVDVWPDGKLRSIYSAREHAPEEFIAADLAARVQRHESAADQRAIRRRAMRSTAARRRSYRDSSPRGSTSASTRASLARLAA